MRMFTETEAAQRECPFKSGSQGPYTCSGSQCMCWHWSKEKPRIFETTMAFFPHAGEQTSEAMPSEELFDRPTGEGWKMSKRGPFWDSTAEVWRVEWIREIDSERHGYCGVAGMPTANWQADLQEALRDAAS